MVTAGDKPASNVAAHATQSNQSNLHPTGLCLIVSRNIALSSDPSFFKSAADPR
jgi:hypothetical protein